MMTEDMDSGRPVSAQFPLRAAWKKGEANQRTSLCALRMEPPTISDSTRRGELNWIGSPHAPKRRALNDNFDGPGKFGALGERLVDVDGRLRVADADLRDGILRIHPFE